MIGRSKAHLVAAGETYWEHLRFARTIGLLSLSAGIACLIHAIIPSLCTTTASRTIGRINQLLPSAAASPTFARRRATRRRSCFC